MPAPIITCPHCQQPISVDEALSHQLNQKLEAEYAQEKKDLERNFQKQLETERKKAAEAAEAEVTKSLQQELTLLKDQNEQKEKKLREAQQAELELRKQKNQLEDDKKAFELEKQRQLDEERNKIREEAEKKATELQSLKTMELEKKLTDALKANDDMKRKLQQGSQQTQGEVLELELENLLRQEFPNDEISPVAKGVRGADVLQVVKDRTGRTCGTILWELKNAQWSEKWLDKLREDQRAAKADLAVLVSINLPTTITNFAYQRGVWISTRPVCLALAHALRHQLNQVFVTKLSAVGKNEKMEVLYGYLSGLEFKQRVEAIVEAFTGMQDDLEKEKRWFASKWAKQEKNLRKVLDHTLGMHGDLQSIMGASLPEIKQLQAGEGPTIESQLRLG